MADHSPRGAANEAAHPLNSVRNAHDIDQHRVLRHDPSNENATPTSRMTRAFPRPTRHPMRLPIIPSQRDPRCSTRRRRGCWQLNVSRMLADWRRPFPLDEIEASGGKTVGTMHTVLAISLVAIVLTFAVLLLRNR